MRDPGLCFLCVSVEMSFGYRYHSLLFGIPAMDEYGNVLVSSNFELYKHLLNLSFLPLVFISVGA